MSDVGEGVFEVSDGAVRIPPPSFGPLIHVVAFVRFARGGGREERV